MTDALARDREDGADLCAPTVGVFSPGIAPGAFLSGGELLGQLQVAGSTRRVHAPTMRGVVRVESVTRGPVQYGQSIVRVVTFSGQALKAVAEAEEKDLPPGSRAVRAPIDGMFFDSPAPDEPPFVTLGAAVSVGQVVGLVEVMKFFYEIRSDTAGHVVRVDAVSGEVVEAEDAIVWVAP